MSYAKDEVALVADIGGTHARFGLALPARAGRPQLVAVRRYFAAEFESLTEAATHYLQDVGPGRGPTRGVFAVASAVTGDVIKITNNPWTFSIRAVGQDLGLSALRVVNDFSALSRTLPMLTAEELWPIGPGQGRSPSLNGNATYAVLGPGTGLGVGCLAIRDGHAVTIDSEGGHAGFAPGSPYELKVLEVLSGQFGRTSAERLISGAGLLNVYKAVCTVEKISAEAGLPEEITEQARTRPGGVAARAVALFCEMLGSFAGDAVLMFGAWDGVFLAGGVAQKVLPWLETGAFRQRFEAKGRHQQLMRSVPSQVVVCPHPELLGAAYLDACH